MPTKIITFNPWLYNKMGHSFIYTESVEKAAELNDWSFIAALPEKCLIEGLRKNWGKTIQCPTVRHWFEAIEKKPYRRPRKAIRARQRVRYYYSVYKLLKAHLLKDTHEKKVLFLEAFAVTDLVLLTNLLRFFPTQKLLLLIVHRYQSSTLKGDVQIFERCHQKLLKMGVEFKLLTDSELLKQDLEKVFSLDLTVLPIHYVEPCTTRKTQNNSQIICWWPGIIREGKGLKIIQQFAESSLYENSRIHLVLNENASLNTHANSPKVTFLENYLSREDYLAWMHQSDVILLPYLDPHYEKATSSIFIEAILSGKMPLVYPGTWMAYELKKFQLDSLVLDWDPSSLSKKIVQTALNTVLLEKLQTIRNYYQKFHTLANYGRVMKELINFS